MEGFTKYFKNTGWLMANRFLGMAIGFFVTAMVTRYLGPENNGTLSFAISFIGLFGFLATLGIDQIVYRDLIKTPEKENEIIGTSLGLRLISGFVAMIIGITFGRILNADNLTFYIMAIVSTTFFFQAFSILTYTFQARVNSYILSIATMSVMVILAILKILAVIKDKNLYYFAFIYALEPILYAVFFLALYKIYYSSPFNWKFNKVLAKRMFLESLPLLLSVVFISIYSRIDQVLLKFMIDTRAVGIYEPAVRLSEVWYFIPAIITSSLFPSLINAQKTDEKSYAKRFFLLTIFLVGLTSLAGLFVSIFARDLMFIVFGEEFVEGYKVLQIYVWSGIGVSLGTIINQFLVAENMVRITLYISLIGMIINVALNLLLIPKYGINGSAFATFISYVFCPLSIMFFTASRQKILSMLKLATS